MVKGNAAGNGLVVIVVVMILAVTVWALLFYCD